MGSLSQENLKKLEALKTQLEGTGFKMPDETTKEKNTTSEELTTKEDKYGISKLSVEERKAIEETAKLWNISLEQATMIFRTAGSIENLQMTNLLRKKVQKKELTYERIDRRIADNDSVVKGYEALEDKYFRNYEAIMEGSISPIQTSMLRRENEQLEKRLEEMKPQVQRAIHERDALCTTLYYGMMVDLLHTKEKEARDLEEYRRQEQAKLLPGLRRKEFGEA